MEEQMNNPIVIRMMPILVDISETLLKKNKKYNEQSRNLQLVLRCKNANCEHCANHQFKSKLVTKIEHAYTKILNFSLNAEEWKQ